MAPDGDLFANECQRRHFAEDRTGLLVAARQTVLGIHDEFAPTTAQSCLHRFLTEVVGDVPVLNQQRRERLPEDPTPRSSDPGLLPLDHPGIDRDGLLIPDAGGSWDHAAARPKSAQDSLFVNDVCPRGQPAPREFRLFRKEEICEALKEPFRHQTALCCELIDGVWDRKLPGEFPRDCSFPSAEILNHLPGKRAQCGRPRGYVGARKTHRQLAWKGQTLKAREWAASIPAADRKEGRLGDERPWSFTVTVRLPEGKPQVRIVIRWRSRHEEQGVKILVTNRIPWEVSRIVRVSRHRWTGTETFHGDGKPQLGRGDCPWREVQGPTRPRYLVRLASRLLMGQLKQGRAKEGALHRLMTLGEACRARAKAALRTTLSWAIEQLPRWEKPEEHVVAQLGLI